MEQLLAFLDSVYQLSPDLRDLLLQIVKEKKIKRKEIILRAGQTSRHIYFIKKGLLHAFYLKDGKDVSCWFMMEGDLVVSILSFYDQVPSFEYIEALEDTEMFYINYDELHSIYNNYLEFNYIGRVLTIAYFKQWAWQLYAIRMQSAEERCEWLLKNRPELVARVPAKNIATYLDITPVTFSNMKAKLANLNSSKAKHSHNPI